MLIVHSLQNITMNNKTQGIMEKSQWDLKHIRFTSSRLNRLDDFVVRYQKTHTALLKEYKDSEKQQQEKVNTLFYCVVIPQAKFLM